MMLAGALVVFENLTGLENPIPSSFSRLLAGGFSFLPCGRLHRAAHSRAVGFPQSEGSKRERTRQRPQCPL